MPKPTEKQIDAMHEVWERTAREWRLREVRGSAYGPDELWVLERNPHASPIGPEIEYTYDIAAHQFHGKNAGRHAKFMLRDKIVKAALIAVLSCKP